MKMIIAGIASVLLLMLLVMFIGLIVGASWCEILTVCGLVLVGLIVALLISGILLIIIDWGCS